MTKTASSNRHTVTLWPSDRELPPGWSLVPFSHLATLCKRREQLDPAATYRVLGMRWYAKGAYVKSVLTGSSIKAPHLYRVEAGDFIYNRLFAWKGSFGVVEDECVGGVVSGEFPCFRTNTPSDAYYLWMLFAQPWLWRLLENESAGTTSTSRLRLKEEDLLRFRIPLPGDDERATLVTALTGQLKRVSAARTALLTQLEAVDALRLAILREAFNQG